MRRILVTGAGGSAGGNFIKALRQSYEEFYIVGVDANRRFLELTKPMLDAAEPILPCSDPYYIKNLNNVIAYYGIDFVHAQPDPEVAVISANRDEINAMVFLPDADVVKLCHDKLDLIHALHSKKVAVPESVIASNYDALYHMLKRDNKKVWLRLRSGAGSRAAIPINNEEMATAWLNYWYEKEGYTSNDFMISRYLPGRDYSITSIWNNGELMASQARERLAYSHGNLSPSGQSSSPSIAVTVSDIRINRLLVDTVKAIAGDTATGIFGLDIKEDDDDVPNVTEINIGRFHTTASSFFTQAGFNFPHAYVKLAFGESYAHHDAVTFNAVEPGQYWIRQMDLENVLL